MCSDKAYQAHHKYKITASSLHNSATRMQISCQWLAQRCECACICWNRAKTCRRRAIVAKIRGTTLANFGRLSLGFPAGGACDRANLAAMPLSSFHINTKLLPQGCELHAYQQQSKVNTHEMSASPNNTGDGAGGNADEKPRLTEEEKKQNHIASGKSAGCAS